MVRAIVLVFLLGFVALASAQYEEGSGSPPLIEVPANLRLFQTPSGGFVDYNDTSVHASVEATKEAVFLASMFSLGRRVNTSGVMAFLESVKNTDGGFSSSRGGVSTLEATHAAVYIFQLLGVQPDPSEIDSIWKFAQSLSTPTGFASSIPAGATSISATVSWFELASLLGVSSEEAYVRAAESVRSYLSVHATAEEQVAFFEDEKSGSSMSFNYNAIRLSALVQYDLETLSPWASHITALQDSTTGCFYSSSSSAELNVESAFQAVHALFTLQQVQPAQSKLSLVELIDVSALSRCIATGVSARISQVAAAHRTLAMTAAFSSNFESKPHLEGDSGSLLTGVSVVQGTPIFPVLAVRNPHSIQGGLDVTVYIEHDENDQPAIVSLHFDAESLSYRTLEPFDSSSTLGPINLHYVIRQSFPIYGTFQYTVQEHKLVGFGIDVTSSAIVSATQREVAVGGAVSTGTDFNFNLNLFTRKQSSIPSGNFMVRFNVYDASGISISSSSLDGHSLEGKPISFNYVLSRSDLPPGPILFQFSVDATRANGTPLPHSRAVVEYQLDSKLSATNVIVPSNIYSLGDRISIQMTPTVTSASGEHVPLAPEHSEKRSFFLDLVTAAGNTAFSVPGTASSSPQGVTFTFAAALPKSLDVIGSFSAIFRFQTSPGQSFRLTNEQADPSISVQASLAFDDAGHAPAASYHYGQVASWSFSIVDQISGSKIVASKAAKAGVFFSLSQGSAVSAHVAVSADSQGAYSLSWPVSINTLSGASTFAIQAEDADGKVIPFSAGVTTHKVDISGRIETDSFTYSTKALTASQTAFMAIIKFTCDNVPLLDAELVANVLFNGSPVPAFANIPIATTPAGAYAVSWTLPVDEAVSGIYQIQYFRKVDLQAASHNNIAASPFASLNIQHHNLSDGKLPIPTEFIVLIILGILTWKVTQLGPNIPKKKK